MENIISGCKKKETNAQHRLYNLYAPKMLALCLRYTKNKQDAEDLLQDGFIKIFENIHQLQDIDKLEGWMKRIFINLALQLLKKQKKSFAVEIGEQHGISDEKAQNVLGKLETKDIINLIKELPAGMQVVLNLYIIDGFQHNEIASLLGISIGTSKSQLHEARKALKKKLQDLQ